MDIVLRDGIVVGLANHIALIGKDGRERSIEDSAALIRDATGTVSGAVMVFHDVTQRRAWEPDAQMMTLLVDERASRLYRALNQRR